METMVVSELTTELSSAMAAFSPAERRILTEVAAHQVNPGFLRDALALAGKPLEKAMKLISLSPLKSLNKARELVQAGIRKGLELSFDAALKLAPEEKVMVRARALGLNASEPDALREAPLDRLDALADSFEKRAMMSLAAEGAALGAATTLVTGIPFAQILIPSLIAADVAASMTLLSRHAAMIGTCYGHSPRNAVTRIHLLAAMAPTDDSPDEGYLTVKTAVAQSIREAGGFLAKYEGQVLHHALLEKEAPQIIKLMNTVAERLGLVLTEKQFGMLVPVAGAALNGGLNVAFHKMGHRSAKDYFRVLTLESRFGDDIVRDALTQLKQLERARSTRR